MPKVSRGAEGSLSINPTTLVLTLTGGGPPETEIITNTGPAPVTNASIIVSYSP
jgi:hypothetical protein